MRYASVLKGKPMAPNPRGPWDTKSPEEPKRTLRRGGTETDTKFREADSTLPHPKLIKQEDKRGTKETLKHARTPVTQVKKKGWKRW